MPKIALIVTSTRKPRIGPLVAEWLAPILKSSAGSDVDLTTIDVADFNLPLFDEEILPAMVPAMGQWTKPYSKAWSEEIEKYDGYVILGNEYNFGMSSSTKNAIDYLYHAWIGKPIYIVTYGIGGGNSASDQLKNVLTGMKLKVVETRPQLAFPGGPYGANTQGAIGGKLEEEAKTTWASEKGEEIRKGWGELLAAVEEKAKEGQGVEGAAEKAA